MGDLVVLGLLFFTKIGQIYEVGLGEKGHRRERAQARKGTGEKGGKSGKGKR